MARINIEDSLYRDNRFCELVLKLGSKEAAVGALVCAWSVAQGYYLTNGGKIPIPVWKQQRLREEIIQVELASISDGEFVYLSGTEKQFKWIKQKKLAGSKGGLEASKRRRDAILDINEEKKQRPIACDSGAQPLTLTLPLSLSLKEKEEYMSNSSASLKESLLEIYQLYPRKRGKTPGIKRLVKEIKSEKDLSDLRSAVENYNKRCALDGTGQQYIKHFSSFVAEWRDWIEADQTDQTSRTHATSLPSVDFSIPVTVAEARHGKL